MERWIYNETSQPCAWHSKQPQSGQKQFFPVGTSAPLMIHCWKTLWGCLLLRSSTLSRRKYKLLDSELLYNSGWQPRVSIPVSFPWEPMLDSVFSMSGVAHCYCHLFLFCSPSYPSSPSFFSLSPHFPFLLYPPFSASKFWNCKPLSHCGLCNAEEQIQGLMNVRQTSNWASSHPSLILNKERWNRLMQYTEWSSERDRPKGFSVPSP